MTHPIDTTSIDRAKIEQGLRDSRVLRAQAFAGMFHAIGRGMRHTARTLVAMFG